MFKISCGRWLIRAVIFILLSFNQTLPASAAKAPKVNQEFIVTTANDGGKGSLRHAIHNANKHPGPDRIHFDAIKGPFAKSKTITLKKELPELTGEVIIDGYIENRLWQSTGVTLSGRNRHPVLRIAPSTKVTISALTIADGHAERGGGILNRGELVVKGVTFRGNKADRDGGGLANLGGNVTLINSTFVDNRAGGAGGGVANDGGKASITHVTFSNNAAKNGGGLFSKGPLLLRNSILANSGSGDDCVLEGLLDPASTHNLIEANRGCGEPISSADPRLEPLGSYNGPTLTLPLGGGSTAINLGDNAAAVDEHGQPLTWDQRGNGDPRFVAGIADIGAFEVQAFPELRVNTVEDTELRACTGVSAGDCSLRGAITLANAMGKAAIITFDPKLFAAPQLFTLTRPLPEATVDLTLDASGSGGVTLRCETEALRAAPKGKLTLREVRLEKLTLPH